MDAKEIEKEGSALRKKELESCFQKLTPKNQMDLIIHAKSLYEKQLQDEITAMFRKLGKEQQAKAVEFVEALCANPRYRK